MRNRVISAFLTVVMLLSLMTSLPVYAAYEGAVVSVQSVSDTAGSLVDVNVVIENNPGILGATFQLEYDDGLTLVDATNGEAFSVLAMTPSATLASPCKFVWDGQDITSEEIKDGTILTLRFKIKETAVDGDSFAVNVSYKTGNIFDANLDPIDVAINNGFVSVIDYMPGDLDGSKEVNSRDIIMLRRHVAGGYVQEINEAAADVDNNGEANSKDIILIRRHIAGGYGVELLPSSPKCEHNLTGFDAVEPTCTTDGNIAYWHCSVCSKYYADKNGITQVKMDGLVVSAPGHTIVIDDAVEPTYESTGLTEGKHCSVCDAVIVKQEEIPALQKEEYSITYYIDNNDEYLQSIAVENPNSRVYTKEDGLVLEDLHVAGYNFVGWYTAQTGGDRVAKIDAGETGNKTLYARWEKVEYTISFYSPIVEKESIRRTIDQEVFIPDLQMHQYKFMGWTDAQGNLVTSVKPGTGNIKLYANWVSYRNQTISNDYKKDKPIIIEDEENQQYFFIYYIGKMVNVPLYTIQDFGNTTSGIVRHESITKTSSISETTANSVTNSIVDSTTNSATWTLSRDWNTLVTNTEDFSETDLQESSILISDGTVRSSSTNENTGTVTDTGTLTKDNTTTKDLTTTKHGNSAELGAELSIGTDAWPVNVDISGKYEQHQDTTEEGGTVTDDGTDTYNLTHTNNLTSKTNSSEYSHNETVSETISNSTQKNWGFSVSDSIGGGESSSEATESTLSNSNSYSTSFSYNTTETTTTVKEFSTEQAMPGWHRLVRAGTVHVFAVVGYDIPTRTYYNYSFSALDDEQYDFYDYSANNGEYNDYETGVLPFEVPIDVHKYVTERVYKTNGLVINAQTGTIVKYEGEDEYVNIPDYISLDNNDGTYSAVKVTGISSNAFANNTLVKEVRLSNYITEIPDNAFSGCTSLETITGANISSIGAGAFRGCVSLAKYTVSETIMNLGEFAFEDVPEVHVVASTSAIAKAAATTSADNLTLDISKITASDVNALELEVGDITSFELQGKDKEYIGLSLKSNAETTIVNGVTFTQNTSIPMEITSSNVILNRVTVDCSGYALVLLADTTELVLNRTVNLMTSTGNAVVLKNVNISSLDSSVLGLLNVTGNIIVCGEIVDDYEAVTVTDGEIIYVTEEEFENYINSHKVTFDANGGSVSEEYRMVPINSAFGELPIPSRDYYTFNGWYTEAEGGEEVTEDSLMTALTDITLFAHWVQNDVSAWTLKSNAPTDAEIVDTKYSYTLTSYTTSSSSSLSGWTQYSSSWVWSDYGSWSGWSTTQYYDSESRDAEQGTQYQWIDTSYWQHQYHYYHFCCSSGAGYLYTYKKSSSYSPHEIWVNSQLTYYKNSGGMNWYKGDYCAAGYSPYWFRADGTGSSVYVPFERDIYIEQGYNSPYSVWRYRDRYKIYTYYFKKNENKESATYPVAPSGCDISNIQELVQYRTK